MNIGQALREMDLRAGATEEEIRRAYRTLVAKWHPDKHQNDPIRLSEAELRIKNINRAFEKLQSVGFQTKKTTSKKDHKAEKNADTKKKSENGDKKQKADGKRNNPNQRTTSTNSTKTKKNTTSKQQWYSCLAIGLVGIALGYLLNELSPSTSGEIEKLVSQNNELRREIEQVTEQKKVVQEEYRSLLLSMNRLQSKVKGLAHLNEDRVKTVKEKIRDIKRLVPPGDNPESEQIAKAYFDTLGSDGKNVVLNSYADRFKFTKEGIREVLLGKNENAKWNFYWDGLLWVDEDSNGDPIKSAVPATKRDRQFNFTEANYNIDLRWVLTLGPEDQFFPVPVVKNSIVSESNPFGKNPRFRGLWLKVTRDPEALGRQEFWDRSIGLIRVDDTMRAERGAEFQAKR